MIYFIFSNIITPLMIMGLCFYPLEYFYPATKQSLWRQDTYLDLSFFVLLAIFIHVLAMAIIAIALKLLWLIFSKPFTLHDLITGFGYLAQFALYWQLLIIALLHDFIGYWVHRAFHHPLLWPFHAVHHASTRVDWLSGFRIHPLETLVMYPARRLVLLAIGLPLPTIMLYEIFFAFFGGLVHCNVNWAWGPLRYVFVSPLFHHWHHSKEKAGENKNFALLFAFWDILFQSWHLPNRFPKAYGIVNFKHKSFFALLLYPFKKSYI